MSLFMGKMEPPKCEGRIPIKVGQDAHAVVAELIREGRIESQAAFYERAVELLRGDVGR